MYNMCHIESLYVLQHFLVKRDQIKYAGIAFYEPSPSTSRMYLAFQEENHIGMYLVGKNNDHVCYSGQVNTQMVDIAQLPGGSWYVKGNIKQILLVNRGSCVAEW